MIAFLAWHLMEWFALDAKPAYALAWGIVLSGLTIVLWGLTW